MTSLITIVVGFILTSVIGNRLVQAWQQRNWLLQQRFLGHEREYLALKDLFDEIASLLGARIYHMQRLAHTLRRGSDAQIADRTVDYDDVLKRWNERLTSFYVRLPLLANYALATQLESSIQKPLQESGSQIEELVYQKRSGKTIDRSSIVNVLKMLNKIQGRAINFNKKLLGVIEARRMEVYYGRKIQFSLVNLEKFSTWQLVKALFIRDVNSFSIVRPTLDLDLPLRSR